MILLDETKIDRVIGATRSLILTGLALLIAPFVLPDGWSFGGLSGFALLSLGVYGATFRNWRIEPGLWMLAIFLTLIFGSAWAVFEWPIVGGLFRGPEPNVPAGPFRWSDVRFWVDGSISLLLFAKIAQFRASVAVGNWKRTRSPEAWRI